VAIYGQSRHAINITTKPAVMDHIPERSTIGFGLIQVKGTGPVCRKKWLGNVRYFKGCYFRCEFCIYRHVRLQLLDRSVADSQMKA